MKPDFPLTRYLCDLIDAKERRITADEVRERWKAGNYRGVNPQWAAEYAKQIGI